MILGPYTTHLQILINDLETIESEDLNQDDMSIKVTLNMSVVSEAKFSESHIHQIDLNLLKSDDYEVLRILVFNGEDLYGTISLDKNTDFGRVDD